MIASWARSIGGPNAITIWSWIVAFPLALVIGVSGSLILGIPLARWLLVVAITQVLLVVPLLLARATYLSDRPRRPRPVVALITFAAIGCMRSILLVGFARLLGVDPDPEVIASWVVAGAFYGMAVLTATAIVVDGIREHRASLQRLRTLRAFIEAGRALDETSRADLEEAFLADVEASLASALEGVRMAHGTRAEVSGALRSVAQEVVRPMSHRLAQDADWGVPAVEPTPPSRGARARELLSAMAPAPPLLPVLAIEFLAVPFLLQAFGPAFAALNLVVGTSFLFALCWLIARFGPRPPMSAPGLVILAVAYAVAGALAALGIALVAGALGMQVPFFWTTAIFLPVAALAVSLLAALDVRRGLIEEEMASALVEEAQETARLRDSLGQLRRRLARTLHSTVQGEFIAVALALAAQEEAGSLQIGRELDRLGRVVTDRMRSSEVASVNAEDRVRDLVSLWDGVLRVDLDAEASVWPLLDADRSMQDHVIDIIAEGLTNAVRHGAATEATVRLRPEGDCLALRIASPGSLSPQARPGFGLASIAESSDHWAFEQSDGVVALEVRLNIT